MYDIYIYIYDIYYIYMCIYIYIHINITFVYIAYFIFCFFFLHWSCARHIYLAQICLLHRQKWLGHVFHWLPTATHQHSSTTVNSHPILSNITKSGWFFQNLSTMILQIVNHQWSMIIDPSIIGLLMPSMFIALIMGWWFFGVNPPWHPVADFDQAWSNWRIPPRRLSGCWPDWLALSSCTDFPLLASLLPSSTALCFSVGSGGQGSNWQILDRVHAWQCSTVRWYAPILSEARRANKTTIWLTTYAFPWPDFCWFFLLNIAGKSPYK